MAQPATESVSVPAFLEPGQQLPTQVSDWFSDSGKQGPSVASIRPGIVAGPIRRHACSRVLFAAALLLSGPVAADAQTAAHWSGNRVTVATGLSDPVGLAVDAAGNVYVGDTNAGRVLKETYAAGTYTQSVVATGLSGPSGVAVDSAGNLYVTENTTGKVYKETLSGSSYTQTQILSGLDYPYGIAVDPAGNLYIGSSDGFAYDGIIKETFSGGVYTATDLDYYDYGVPYAYGVAVDGSGNVYFSYYNSDSSFPSGVIK